jgi:hypothetical protein
MLFIQRIIVSRYINETIKKINNKQRWMKLSNEKQNRKITFEAPKNFIVMIIVIKNSLLVKI